MTTEFYDQFFCKENDIYSVIIEDDGKVAYAYLLYKENIIGDVWLYNQSPTPQKSNWKDESKMPFLNPREYILENIPPISNQTKILLDWELSNSFDIDKVSIFVENRLIAMLKNGSNPGWSTVVIKDGPLAKVLKCN